MLVRLIKKIRSTNSRVEYEVASSISRNLALMAGTKAANWSSVAAKIFSR